MKVLHIADTHLGATPHGNNAWNINREKELWQTFERVIQRAEEERADLLLIAGDMFHRQPLLRELKELNFFFSKLTHTKVVFIAGNHDYIKENSYYNTFTWASNVTCLKDAKGESVYFPELNTEVYGLSYHHYEIKEDLYKNFAPRDSKRWNILLAHGGDEKHIPFSKTDLGSKGFDYIALGHIHIPEIILPGKMAYAGALEPTDIGDEGVHGFMLLELDKQNSKLEFVEFAKRKYTTLDIQTYASYTNGKLIQTIRERLRDVGREDFVKIYIRGYREPDITYDLEEVYKLGLVATVEDYSEPDYDFEKLEKEYQRNIVGKFIHNMNHEALTKVEKKALYYGVQAMFDEMR